MKRFYYKIEVAIFKRWTRQKFAIFNSLKKVIAIATIALICSFLMKPTHTLGQTQEDTIKKLLDEVQVTADAPLETDHIEHLLLHDYLQLQTIEQSPVHAVNELLEQLSGVDIRQRGPFGTQADISIRGGTFDQTILLINGINFTDPQTGHYTLNLPISPDIIKKIELYKNSASFLFGTAPFSGVLNIITHIDTISLFKFHLMTGMYGLYRIHTQLNWKNKQFRHLLSSEYSHCNGYIPNTDFNMVSGFYQTLGELKKGTLQFQMGYNQKKYGANHFYSLRFPAQYEETETFFYSIQWKKRGQIGFQPSLYFRLNDDRFQLVKWQNPQHDNIHLNALLGTNILTYFHSMAGKTSFLMDYRFEGIISSSLGVALPKPLIKKRENKVYGYGVSRLLIALSISHKYSYKGFTLEGSYILQHLTSIPKRLFHLPSLFLSYGWQLPQQSERNSNVHFFLAANKTLRYPTFTDLYYKTGDILGNAQLQPEEAVTAECGIQWKWQKTGNREPFFQAECSFFYRYGFHLIDYIKKEEEEHWQAMNLSAVQFAGLDVMLTFTPQQIWKNFPFLNQFSVQYNYLYSDKTNLPFQSKYVLDHLIHQLNITLDGKIYKGLSFYISTLYAHRKGNYLSYKKELPPEPKPYPPYLLIDIRLQYLIRQQYTFYLQINNLLNQRYFDIGGLTQPGIWVSGGVKYRLGRSL